MPPVYIELLTALAVLNHWIRQGRIGRIGCTNKLDVGKINLPVTSPKEMLPGGVNDESMLYITTNSASAT